MKVERFGTDECLSEQKREGRAHDNLSTGSVKMIDPLLSYTIFILFLERVIKICY